MGTEASRKIVTFIAPKTLWTLYRTLMNLNINFDEFVNLICNVFISSEICLAPVE